MTENEFFQRALLQIAANSSFGNGHGSYVDYYSWANRINEAAAALRDIAERSTVFDDDEPDEPP